MEKSHDPAHVKHQEEVAQLSKRELSSVVQGAGHHIHLDKPETVVAAIEQVVREARAGKAGPR